MPSCHDVTEILPGCFLGSASQLPELLALHTDILLPLEPMILPRQFDGEILNYPIEDGEILPWEELCELMETLSDALDHGKTMAIFCQSGHGCTGYIAACLLIRRGVSRPVAHLQLHYCRGAIESLEQEIAVELYREHRKHLSAKSKGHVSKNAGKTHKSHATDTRHRELQLQA